MFDPATSDVGEALGMVSAKSETCCRANDFVAELFGEAGSGVGPVVSATESSGTRPAGPGGRVSVNASIMTALPAG